MLWTALHPYGCYQMCLTDNDFKNLPSGDVVDKLLQEWQSGRVEGITDEHGSHSFYGFLGEYRVSVRYRNRTTDSTFSLGRGEETRHVTVTLWLFILFMELLRFTRNFIFKFKLLLWLSEMIRYVQCSNVKYASLSFQIVECLIKITHCPIYSLWLHISQPDYHAWAGQRRTKSLLITTLIANFFKHKYFSILYYSRLLSSFPICLIYLFSFWFFR